MSFPRYPAYKPSGVEWLGEVPEHWEALRLRFVATLNPSKQEARELGNKEVVSFLPMEAIGEDGSLRLEQEKEISECLSGYTYFRDGDVCIAKITPCFENGKGAILRELKGGIGFGTTELIVARPDNKKITSEFLDYVFRSQTFRRLGESEMYGAGGQKRVPDSFVSDFTAILPSIEEQSQIATFLDRETAKIDALIAEQQRLIELLQEKRQAMISHAVTKGLNPDAPMKDSGVEWLGEVPEHWEVKPLRYCFEIRNNLRTPIDVATRSEIEGLYPYYGPTGILSHINRFVVEGKHFLIGEDGDHFLRFDRLPMTLMVAGRFNVNNHAHLLRGMNGALTEWGALFFEHRDLQPWLIKQGVGRYKLRKERLLEIPVPLPPLLEQEEIVMFTRKAKISIDQTTEACNEQIALLQERRSALISAVVTGQIDVRGLVPEVDQPMGLQPATTAGNI